MLDFLSTVKPAPALPVLVPMPAETRAPFTPAKPSPPRQIRRRHLQGLTKSQLAFVAVDVLRGRATIDVCTIGRLSRVLGVSTTYISYALNASGEDRRKIEAGKLSLTGSARPNTSPPLARAWDRATPDQQREFVRERGNQILDRV